ncbi:hypothetical protein LIER_20965 [Lithospermum erythrorhizon]|uniref:Plastid lipid-associated protein/fibrillin conserved domain-containing protein n=1 Tax=Lithospermum erythrorhizon TaxID=34254 RepID=A0AAV3QPK0_LITER
MMSSFHLLHSKPPLLSPSPPKLHVLTQPRNRPPTFSAILQSPKQQNLQLELEDKKYQLLTSIQDTQKGLLTTPDQRSSIEDALVAVETFNATTITTPIDLDKLNGTWRLQYTSAPDVLVLFESSSRLQSLFQIGQIYQKFECSTSSSSNLVKNVIKFSIPNLLEDQEGATLVVSAKFSMVSKRNIYLEFQEIGLQDLVISEQLQALIAPAILPRSFISLQILQFIRSFKYQVPVRRGGASSSGGVGRGVTTSSRVGGLYYLSYLDNNMLLGRAVGGGGVFVFSRAQPLAL